MNIVSFRLTGETTEFLLLFWIIIFTILPLFKKISWFWLFSLLCRWLTLFIGGIIVEYITIEEPYMMGVDEIQPKNTGTSNLIFLLIIPLFFLGYFLPVIVSLIQYRIKKINAELLKHRLRIWFACGLPIYGSIMIFTSLLVFFLIK